VGDPVDFVKRIGEEGDAHESPGLQSVFPPAGERLTEGGANAT